MVKALSITALDISSRSKPKKAQSVGKKMKIRKMNPKYSQPSVNMPFHGMTDEEALKQIGGELKLDIDQYKILKEDSEFKKAMVME